MHSLQKVCTKVAVLNGEAVPKYREDAVLCTANVCVAGGREHQDSEFMLSAGSVAFMLPKSTSFRSRPLPAP